MFADSSALGLGYDVLGPSELHGYNLPAPVMEAEEGKMAKASGNCASPGSLSTRGCGDKQGDGDEDVGRCVFRAMSPGKPQLRQESGV